MVLRTFKHQNTWRFFTMVHLQITEALSTSPIPCPIHVFIYILYKKPINMSSYVLTKGGDCTNLIYS